MSVEEADDTEDPQGPSARYQERTTRVRTQAHLHAMTFVVKFPGIHAGSPVNGERDRSAYEKYQKTADANGDSPVFHPVFS